MKIIHRVEKRICLVTIFGNLALSENQELHNYLLPLIKAAEVKKILLNFQDVHIIDSKGVGLIASTYQDLEKAEKQLLLCSLSQDCFKLLELLKLNRMITIYESESEALAEEFKA
ncbi:STAS domain-containing protein [Deltaproteobacteria bacterium TL4]